MQALEPSRPTPRVLRQPRSTPPAGGRVLARPRSTSDRFAHGEATGQEKPPARRAEERAVGTATAPRMAGLGFSAQLRFLCGTRPLRIAAAVGQGRGGPRAALLQSEHQGVDGAGCPAVVRVSRLQTEHRASPHRCVAGDRPPWPPAKARTECGAGSCGGPAHARDGGPAWAGPRRVRRRTASIAEDEELARRHRWGASGAAVAARTARRRRTSTRLARPCVRTLDAASLGG